METAKLNCRKFNFLKDIIKQKIIVLDILILLLFSILAFYIYFSINFKGLTYPDAWSYSSLAKNIVSGKGYITNFVHATTFIFKIKPFHEINNYILPTFVLSAFLRVFGSHDWVTAIYSGTFYILGVIPFYLLAYLLAGRLAAIFASILYIFEPTILHLSISGLTETMFIFFILTAFLGLFVILGEGRLRSFFLIGLLFGLCRLTRINAILFVLPVLIILYFLYRRDSCKTIITFLLGFISISIPDFWLNYINYGNPLFAGHASAFASGTIHFPGTSIAHTLKPIFTLEYISTYPKWFLEKYITNFMFYFSNVFTLTNPLIIALSLGGLFSIKYEKHNRFLHYVIFIAIILQIILLSTNCSEIRYFYIFIPFLLIFGVRYFASVANAFATVNGKNFFLSFICLLLLLPNLYKIIVTTYLSAHRTSDYSNQTIAHYIKKYTKPDDIIATDFFSITWYADRKILQLPVSIETFEQIDKKYLPVDAIFLTDLTLYSGRSFTGVEEGLIGWQEMLYNPQERFGEFKLIETGKISGHKFALFLKDREYSKNSQKEEWILPGSKDDDIKH